MFKSKGAAIYTRGQGGAMLPRVRERKICPLGKFSPPQGQRGKMAEKRRKEGEKIYKEIKYPHSCPAVLEFLDNSFPLFIIYSIPIFHFFCTQ